jgi:hypothetical protein
MAPWASGSSLGGELVAAGLRDLEAGVESVPALLVSIGAPRLRRLGFRVPRTIPQPEHRLYELLAREDPDSAQVDPRAFPRAVEEAFQPGGAA